MNSLQGLVFVMSSMIAVLCAFGLLTMVIEYEKYQNEIWTTWLFLLVGLIIGGIISCILWKKHR